MRVIAGTYRSRRLITPRGPATRPTSDRLRETLFNILAQRVEGAVFADLYAGSGAVGIEALSRGASIAYFVEQAAPAVAGIRANLASLEIRSGFQIDSCSVSAALRRLSAPSPQGQRLLGACGIIFMDPPYGAAAEYADTLAALGRQAASLLAPNGIVVAEHARKTTQPLADSYGPLRRYRVLEQGDAGLSFYRISP
jgi:16S rRNA (guanine966-N2)-methyltransferase